MWKGGGEKREQVLEIWQGKGREGYNMYDIPSRRYRTLFDFGPRLA